MTFHKNKIDQNHFNKIYNDFILNNSDCMGILTEGSSNKIKNKKFMFASWSGPEAHVGNICHEISHFIEIDKKRCHFPSWGLKYKKWRGNETFGFYDITQDTNKAIMREIRTFGIQVVIHERHGIHWVHDSFLKRKEIMHMAHLCGYIDGLLYFYPEDWRDKERWTISECREYAYEVIQNLIDNESKKWSYESIIREFNKKVNILREKIKNGCYDEMRE